jgi:hypothetical protein
MTIVTPHCMYAICMPACVLLVASCVCPKTPSLLICVKNPPKNTEESKCEKGIPSLKSRKWKEKETKCKCKCKRIPSSRLYAPHRRIHHMLIVYFPRCRNKKERRDKKEVVKKLWKCTTGFRNPSVMHLADWKGRGSQAIVKSRACGCVSGLSVGVARRRRIESAGPLERCLTDVRW